ncbi:DUF975 family protein [Oceanirhabdus sp. W0125-5]|uniref:DUF975 family protein n=1 Tax=Oceanirhabdus sp. W0125-5 TaxID=2999116 RepID=UPI0022F2B498|nr:DUF975 family protein [Oceanirhabdus sp. W0125-5]WBW98131.1 DUF975 family protein [Oceanirhabdus sp. W0125-5]
MLWTRELLKSRAKEVLRASYWKALLVSVILFFLGAGGSASYSRSSQNRINYHIDNTDFNLYHPIIFTIIIVALVIILLAFLFSIFVSNPIEVGGKKYFLKSTQMDFDINEIGYSFNKERYSNIVKTMFFKNLYIFLWSLLLIIPGIVKHYAYKMVPYILCDNPNMDYDRAIELSTQMTQGHKFDMWVLELSFIGWHILSLFIPFVGGFLVMPYTSATEAELYLVLKDNAIGMGLCDPSELTDF